MSTRGASASESSLTRNFTNERAGERAAPLRTGRSVNQIFRLENTFKLRGQSSRCIYIMESCNYFKQGGRFCFLQRRISLTRWLQARPALSPDRKKAPSEKYRGTAKERNDLLEQRGGEPLTINLLVREQLKPGPGSVLARQDIIQVAIWHQANVKSR